MTLQTYDQQHRELHSLERQLLSYRMPGAEGTVSPRQIYRTEVEYSLLLMRFRRSGQWEEFRKHLDWYRDYLGWEFPHSQRGA